MLIWHIARKGCLCCAFLAATSVVGLSQTSAVSPATVSPAVVSPGNQADAVFIKEFYARVSKYLDLRKKEAGSPPKPTKSAIKLNESKNAMAEKIQAARADAKQGDIFTPEIEAYFRKRIATAMRGRNGTKMRSSLRHAEPVHSMPLHVNQPYPDGVPLQSVPPTLLMNLPRLPKDLEYRIVGHDLALHDIAPNLIVDFIPGAIPSP
ncbi:MAG TPA: hypothetical protein VK555_02780 [Terriglobales bacterium]|jgi:hypothetical protein|nr:hypothetical protein [Terriglobales bacterium]